MKTYRLMFIAALGMCSVVMPACEATKQALTSAPDVSKLFGNWNLSQLGGKEIASMIPSGGTTPTLSIAKDGGISGTGGVNRIMSSVDLDKLASGEFSMRPAASTMMAGNQQAMDLEANYLKTLHQVTNFRLDGNTLSLTNGKETLLKFLRAGS